MEKEWKETERDRKRKPGRDLTNAFLLVSVLYSFTDTEEVGAHRHVCERVPVVKS